MILSNKTAPLYAINTRLPYLAGSHAVCFNG